MTSPDHTNAAAVRRLLHQGYLDANPDLVARLTASRERQRAAEDADDQTKEQNDG